MASSELLALPRAAVLMLWAGAYLRGDAGPDDAAQHALGTGKDRPGAEGVELFDWLTGLRRLPLVQLRLVLPVPGRIAGLVGPPTAVQAALAAEQALVVTAAGIPDHTLVPEDTPVSSLQGPIALVDWMQYPAPLGANLAPASSSGTAREQLLRVMQRVADSSQDLDLVPDEPIPARNLPSGWARTMPPRHVTAADAHLLTLAGRILALSAQELRAGSPTARALADDQARRRLLEELRDAAREALVETVQRAADPEG